MTVNLGRIRPEPDREWLGCRVLQGAHQRAFELGNDAYESQVLEFLDEADRAANAGKWEENQLVAAMLIESILDSKGVS